MEDLLAQMVIPAVVRQLNAVARTRQIDREDLADRRRRTVPGLHGVRLMTIDAWLALASPALIFGLMAGLEALTDWWWHE